MGNSPVSAPATIASNQTNLTTNLPAVYQYSDIAIVDVLNTIRKVAGFFVSGIFGTLGIPMNLLIVIVYSRCPKLVSETTRVYYIAIGFCDLMTSIMRDICLSFLYFGLDFATQGRIAINIELQSVWMCRLWDFGMFGFELVSNWVYIPLESERIIAMFFPLQARRIITPRRATIAIGSVVCLGVVMVACLPAGGSLTPMNSDGFVTSCYVDYGSGDFVSYWAIVMLQFTFMVPEIVITILSIVMAIKLANLASERVTLYKSSNLGGSRATDRKLLETSVTLLVVCAVHDSIELPMGVFRSLPLYVNVSTSSYSYVASLALLFYPFLSIKSALNFIIFVFRVKGFKDEIVLLLCPARFCSAKCLKDK